MADTMRGVEYYVTVPDAAGEGERILSALRDSGTYARRDSRLRPAVVSATAPTRSSPWIRNARFASLSVTPARSAASRGHG
jgi:hypothetical protein